MKLFESKYLFIVIRIRVSFIESFYNVPGYAGI